MFFFSLQSNNLNNSTISSSEVSITAIKATKEGPRRILIVTSKSKEIQIRDASSGLLLRTLNLPDAMKAYSLLLDDGCIFCGTQRRDILKIDFTVSKLKKKTFAINLVKTIIKCVHFSTDWSTFIRNKLRQWSSVDAALSK